MTRIVGGIIGFISVFWVSALSWAQEHQVSAATKEPSLTAALAIASGLGIALAAFGGALAQGRTAAAALEGIARNPEVASKIQTPMIIGLALIESLVIYALVIAFLLQGKI